MIRIALAFWLLAIGVSDAQMRPPKTSIWAGNRADYAAWSQLVYGVISSCEAVFYLDATNAPRYNVRPNNYHETLPMSVGMGVGSVVTQAYAGGTNYYTNYTVGTVPVVFTNFIGRLYSHDYGAWASTQRYHFAEWDFGDFIEATNLLMTAVNINTLDSSLIALVTNYVDMRQVNAAGGAEAWFSTPRPKWEWVWNEDGNSGEWKQFDRYPTNLPFLTISNAWAYAGLPVRYYEQPTTIPTQFISGAYRDGWEVGRYDQKTVLHYIFTNRVWQYSFSLSPTVETYNLEIGSMRLQTVNLSVTTNEVGVVRTTRTLGWRQQKAFDYETDNTRNYFGNEMISAFTNETTSAVVRASITFPVTNHLALPGVHILVTGVLFASSFPYQPPYGTPGVQLITGATETVSFSGSKTLPPFQRILSITSEWSYTEINHQPPQTSDAPFSIEGAVLAVHWSNSYIRLHQPGTLHGLGFGAYETALTDFSDSIHVEERLAILTQLTHTAVSVAPSVFYERTAVAVPWTIDRMPISNGYYYVEYGDPNYDTVGGRGWEGLRSSCDYRRSVRTGSCGENWDRITDSCDGFEFAGYANNLSGPINDYSYVDPSRHSGGFVWSWSAQISRGSYYSADKTTTYHRRSRYPQYPPGHFLHGTNCVESYSLNDENESRPDSRPKVYWPYTFDLVLRGITSNKAARMHLFVMLSNTVDTASAKQRLDTMRRFEDEYCNTENDVSEDFPSLLPNPAEILEDGFLAHYGTAEKKKDVSKVMWLDLDFIGGISPDSSWIGNWSDEEEATCNHRESTVSTGETTIVRTTINNDYKLRNYVSYPIYRDFRRELQRVVILIDWRDPFHN